MNKKTKDDYSNYSRSLESYILYMIKGFFTL